MKLLNNIILTINKKPFLIRKLLIYIYILVYILIIIFFIFGILLPEFFIEDEHIKKSIGTAIIKSLIYVIAKSSNVFIENFINFFNIKCPSGNEDGSCNGWFNILFIVNFFITIGSLYLVGTIIGKLILKYKKK